MLDLSDVEVLLGKISNNIEMHGEDEVIAYDVPCEGMIPPAQLEGLLGQYCDRTLFNTKGEIQEPSELFKHTTMPLHVDEDLQAEHVSFTLSDNLERTFGGKKDNDKVETLPISKIRYEPKLGGLVWVAFSIRIRPKDKHESWAFLEHQHRHAKLSISDSTVALKKASKQQELPLGGGDASPPAQASTDEKAGDAHPDPDAQNAAPPAPPTSSSSSSIAEIGPKTRAEIEKAANRRGRRGAGDGRKGAH